MNARPRGRWTPIAPRDVDAWNGRLRQTSASLFQYPYWNEPLRALRFTPRYFLYAAGGEPDAYVCVLTLGVPGARVGLVQRGPVPLGTDPLPDGALAALASWARRRGYAFLRFTHSRADVLDRVASMRGGRRVDAFPFYREPGEELLVSLDASHDDVFARFQPIARREIRKAEAEPYRVEKTTTGEALAAAWPLFERLAERKGFNYRPLGSYRELMRRAAPYGGARLYTASLGDRLVEAILLVRDGRTAHYVSGALDVEALGDHNSPSAMLHWIAMRDLAAESVCSYNLGSRSGPVYQFKRKFRPVEMSCPPAVTLVTNRVAYAAWDALALRFLRLHWRAIKKVAARVLAGRRVSVGTA